MIAQNLVERRELSRAEMKMSQAKLCRGHVDQVTSPETSHVKKPQ